jgi:hypothetical protein
MDRIVPGTIVVVLQFVLQLCWSVLGLETRCRTDSSFLSKVVTRRGEGLAAKGLAITRNDEMDLVEVALEESQPSQALVAKVRETTLKGLEVGVPEVFVAWKPSPSSVSLEVHRIWSASWWLLVMDPSLCRKQSSRRETGRDTKSCLW